MSNKWKRYLGRHYDGGDWYEVEIWAHSEEHAQEICRKHSLQYDGRLVMRTRFELVARVWCWLMNLFGR